MLVKRVPEWLAPKRKANITDGASPSSSVIKRQTTLKQSATGRLDLQLPFVNAKVGDGFFSTKNCYNRAIEGL